MRRGALTALLLIGFAWTVDNDSSWQLMLAVGMLTLWAFFGVYRTIVQARAPAQSKDLV